MLSHTQQAESGRGVLPQPEPTLPMSSPASALISSSGCGAAGGRAASAAACAARLPAAGALASWDRSMSPSCPATVCRCSFGWRELEVVVS